jgi:hypothetical protein
MRSSRRMRVRLGFTFAFISKSPGSKIRIACSLADYTVTITI